MATKQVVYRDSRDGRFVSKREAERRPATTERQHIVVHRPGLSIWKK